MYGQDIICDIWMSTFEISQKNTKPIIWKIRFYVL